MKGEYVEGNSITSRSNNMFAKLHQQKLQQLHLHHQTQQHQQPPQQQQQLVSRECQNSEENESRSSGGAAAAQSKKFKMDDGTIEAVRRPRGRPPGSKNKPKPPVIITRDTGSAMRPQLLEVPGGLDVIDAIARFSRHRNIGLIVLTGSGTVANVTLRQLSSNPAATVTFHGRFDILSISATFLPPSSSSLLSPSNGFTISLAGPQGQIFGGSVVGTLLAVGTVLVMAASFTNMSYHCLSGEDEEPNSVSGNAELSSPAGAGDGSHPPAETCGMSIYGCHVASDGIWTPTARPPLPF